MLRQIMAFMALALGCGVLAGEAAYVPGTGEGVKNWSAQQEWERAGSFKQPIAVYFYNGADKGPNPDAKFLEGSDVTGNADVQKMLRKFQCVKMDTSKPIPKGWPGNITGAGKAGKCCLILLTPDMTKVSAFKKVAGNGMGVAEAKAIAAAADPMIKHQEKIAAAIAERDKKNAPPEPKEVAKTKIGVLKDADDKDKDNKQPPPPPKKVDGPVDE
jgi:hypothetical protein